MDENPTDMQNETMPKHQKLKYLRIRHNKKPTNQIYPTSLFSNKIIDPNSLWKSKNITKLKLAFLISYEIEMLALIQTGDMNAFK